MSKIRRYRCPDITYRHPLPRFRKREERYEKKNEFETIGEMFYKVRYMKEQKTCKHNVIWINPKHFKKPITKKRFKELLAVISHEYLHYLITKDVNFTTSISFDNICWKDGKIPDTTNGID